MSPEIISVIGIIISLVLLSYLVMKGANLFLVAMLATCIVALTGQIGLYQAITGDYMSGWAGFVQGNFILFVAGAILGKVYEVTGAAKSIARVLISRINPKYAGVAIILAVGVLTYGGITGYVVVFAVYPIALEIFRAADLPRRFIPGSIIFGACSFSSIMPGNPQIGNVVLIKALGTTLTAGWVVGVITGFAMLILGCIWLQKLVDRAVARGEHFELRATDDFGKSEGDLPNPWMALLPLVVCLLLINIKINGKAILQAEFGLVVGAVLAYAVLHKYHTDGSSKMSLATDGVKNAITAATTAAGIVGFGSVVKAASGFPVIVNSISKIPGPDTVALAVATNVVAGVCGTASGGMAIAAPILAPMFLERGMTPEMFHRVMLVSSTALDTLPHCGFVCLIANGVCGESHKDAYPIVFQISVLLPIIITVLCILLYAFFPNLP